MKAVIISHEPFVAKVQTSMQEADRASALGFRWHHKFKCGTKACAACVAGLGTTYWTKDPTRLRGMDMEPHDAGFLARLLEEDEEIRRESRATAPTGDPPLVDPDARLRPYQTAGVEWLLRHAFGIQADEMGLGKTIQAIVAWRNLRPRPALTLVVCPAALRIMWGRAIESWAPGAPVLVSGSELGREYSLSGERVVTPEREYSLIGGWIVTGYDQVVTRDIPQPSLLIVDEGHYVKNSDAKRSKAVLQLARRADRVWILTGTPIANRPRDAWMLLHMVDPKRFPSEWAFRNRFCGKRTFTVTRKTKDGKRATREVTTYDGLSNGAELSRMLSRVMVRRLKGDVARDLPPMQRVLIPLPASKTALPMVKLEIEAFRKWEEAADLQAKTAAFHELQLVRHAISLEKAPAIVNLAEDILEQEEQLVIFTVFLETTEVLGKALGRHGVAVFTGKTSTSERQAAIDSFQAGEKKVFIGTIAASGVGLTLHAASVCLFADIDAVETRMAQAIARLHRIGQVNPVTAYIPVMDGSLDAHFARLLIEKETQAEEVLKDKWGK